jgi:hypothetical protein
MVKSPYDVRIITNEPEHFKEDIQKWGERVIIKHDDLSNNQIYVGAFNQMLKYKTMQDVSKKYDWLLYLDCDAGFTDTLNSAQIDSFLAYVEEQGYDMLGTRTNCIVKNELFDHESKIKKWEQDPSQYNPGNLFSSKFIFYKMSSDKGPFEWFDAVLPSEHVLLIKNNEKLAIMATEFEKFNQKFETQVDLPYIITYDMEAFEIGVSAKLAGYNVGDFGNDGLYHIIKVVCNHNNWEKVKY